jgi:heterodisulfide reductase subunit D
LASFADRNEMSLPGSGESQQMNGMSFETALGRRTDQMLDACVKCGKCVDVCPSVQPANLGGISSREVIAGVLDIVRSGDGPDVSHKWAASCMLSGECIKACDYGVNPRFLLAMARAATTRRLRSLPERRRDGVLTYRGTSQDVAVLSRLQLEAAALERLGQGPASVAKPGEPPDFVFYTGCNVLKTPHIALLALDIMDTLGVSYQVMGGPSHCCGILQMRAGDAEMSGRMGSTSMAKMAQSKLGQVLSWCPSCYVQFTETTLPTLEKQGSAPPFEMTPFIRFLRTRLGDLQPYLRERVDLRVALHQHPGVAGVMEAAADMLRAVPGVTLVDLHQPAVGLQSINLAVLPEYRRKLELSELEAARDAGVDALVTVYHSDHRALCAHQRDWPFSVVNLLEIVGQGMGLYRHDRFKELKIMQDADLIVAECRDLISEHALDPQLARDVVAKAMLGEQPLPLDCRGAPCEDTVAPGNNV